ncbi:MAG: AAA family ATPase [Verrucomicrobiota bacterium]
MKLATARIHGFKRFTDLSILDLPKSARLVVLVGPNGCGKSSLFEAFNFWMSRARNQHAYDEFYHPKAGSPAALTSHSALMSQIELTFHGCPSDPRQNPDCAKKIFYLRSAYRHEPEFNLNQFMRAADILIDERRPARMNSGEMRVSDNYQRIVTSSVDALFDPAGQNRTAAEITGELVGRVREGMSRLFDDLLLEGPGRPMQQDGTFLFTKGASRRFHYKNLSGGEMAAFDLLLDFVIKSKVFDNTVFCIDEPELHMHTKLQGRLLAELLRQLPAGCQLWLASHSIGMTRQAMELHRKDRSDVVFLDFANRDFDSKIEMRPADVNRALWKGMFSIALDDLAGLVAPSEVIFCEGRREGSGPRRSPTFDAHVYRTIFDQRHPGTEFLPLGGTKDVERDGILLSSVLSQIHPAIKTWKVFDRDDRSALEIAELQKQGIKVLGRRDLESYLWDDEIITALAVQSSNPTEASAIIAKKQQLLADLSSRNLPPDDIKAIGGPLYNEAKARLHLKGCGNDAVEFARATLAPLVGPETRVYAELESAVFS